MQVRQMMMIMIEMMMKIRMKMIITMKMMIKMNLTTSKENFIEFNCTTLSLSSKQSFSE